MNNKVRILFVYDNDLDGDDNDDKDEGGNDEDGDEDPCRNATSATASLNLSSTSRCSFPRSRRRGSCNGGQRRGVALSRHRSTIPKTGRQKTLTKGNLGHVGTGLGSGEREREREREKKKRKKERKKKDRQTDWCLKRQRKRLISLKLPAEFHNHYHCFLNQLTEETRIIL